MFFNDDTCPFVEPEFCNEKCMFRHNEKGSCIFKHLNDTTEHGVNLLKNARNYTGGLENQESEFYIWDNNRNAYDMIKWEYPGEMRDF